MKKIILISIISCIATSAFADTLPEQREAVIQAYVNDLQTADYKHIATLFDKNGYVISTSKGKVNAKEFFYNFLPNVSTASAQLKHRFADVMNADRYSARFHFEFQLKDGESGKGEYMDEFLFEKNSAHLTYVAMFENLKFS